MFKILKKENLAPNIYLMDVEAPRVARNALPGQFLIVRVDDEGERVPLTICDYDAAAGTVQIVFQVIGGETYRMAELNVGDSVRAMIVRVDPDAVGRPAVTLSRACNEFVKVLFRLEVSEIADGTVEIMSVARDPGYRCKIAVRSLDDKVDPVGACVGQRGARVRNIVTELCGEKIDVVRWSDDIKTFVAQALLPAKLDSIEIDSDSRRLVDVVVAPDQYKLAIGKSGHNVRLTSQLVGWRVEVRKSLAGASFEEQKAQAVKTLADTFSIPTAKATQIADAGFLTVEGIITADEATFAASTGLDPVAARGIYAAAQAVAELTGVGRDAAAETPAEEPAADAEEPAYAEPAAGDPAQETTPGAEG